MNISLACSPDNEEFLTNLKSWLALKTNAEVYRLALAYSFNSSNPLTYEGPIESGGSVVKESTLFGQDEKIYLGVLKMLHNLREDATEETFTSYLRLHLNHGLEQLHKLLNNASDAHTNLLTLINEQSVFLPHMPDTGPEPIVLPDLKITACASPIRLHIGQRDGQPVHFTYNSRQYANQHLAIVGMSGSGKTYFAYSLLSQIYRQSQQRVHFLFIDYKGLTAGQLSRDQQRFQQQTGFQLIDFVNQSFPINPIRPIRNANSRRQENFIRSFADILTDLSNLGEVQRNTLIDVLKSQLAKVKDHLPTLETLADEVKTADRKIDKLTTVLDNLRGYFEDRQEFEQFLQTNTYLSVDASLSDDARIGAVVLVLNLLLNQFSRLGEAESNSEYAGLRYVVLIDEAHVVFKHAKAQKILDQMLRTLRSYGVAVILSSQTLGEFTKDNLGANIASTFLFDSGGVSEPMAKQFMRLSSSEAAQFRHDANNLEKYSYVTNLAELGGYATVSSHGLDI